MNFQMDTFSKELLKEFPKKLFFFFENNCGLTPEEMVSDILTLSSSDFLVF